MANLHDLLDSYVGNGSIPGAVALVARGDRVDGQAVGSLDVEDMLGPRDGRRPRAALARVGAAADHPTN